MHIGIFGGTFDPPHLGHSAVVSECLRQKLFDAVWYLPAVVHDPQFSKPWMSSSKHRLAMLELVVAEHQARGEAVRVETLEIDEKMPGLTHATLRELAQRHPEHSFSFIIGSDQLAKLHLWGCDIETACFPGIFAEFDWYVYPRGGAPIIQLPFAELKTIAGVEPVEIGSTDIRERVKKYLSLENFVTQVVAEYVLGHKLYQ